jgi:4-hydroxybenzoate polyprenyltransferase/phosphoserine phosphatase
MSHADTQAKLFQPGLRHEVPLCVDLDGTLVRTDLLVESWFALLKHNPLAALLAPSWLCWGKARLKHEIARRVDLDAASLPYHAGFLEYLRAQHRQGRRLVLATASNEKYANQVARHLRIFERVIASDAQTNAAAEQKHRLLTERFGVGGYDYAGNARCDLVVCSGARQAILVNPVKALERASSKLPPVARSFSERHTLKPYLHALRPHQWLKNLLLFMPLVAAHRLAEPALVAQVTLAFVAFSLCASSVYLLNDLMDLPADRAHPRKRERPFASGAASAKVGALLIPALLAVAFGIAASLSGALAVALAVYFACTFAYSLWLKGKVMIDVLLLAALYTLRILAGAAAVAIEPSFWLLAFSMFVFLSLAMVKRYAELFDLKRSGIEAAQGRGYMVMDLATIQAQGAAAGYCAVLVLALYINSGDVHAHYAHPQAIWLLCPLLLYWISRMWQKAGLGVMHDDPMIFALKDRVSRWLAAAGAMVLVAASWI